jgi:predicted transcriptional regulator of viral defense system
MIHMWLHLSSMHPQPTDLPTAFTYATARASGLSEHHLRALVEDGTLDHFGLGLYRRADAPPADLDLVEVALRAPDCALCLNSALSHHDLTDTIPSVIDVALPRSRRPPRVGAPVRWHRFHADTFDLGREHLLVDDGIQLGIYGPERCIVDAFRLRHILGEQVAVEALRRWLRRSGSTPSSLLEFARPFPKAEPALRDTLRVLL